MEISYFVNKTGSDVITERMESYTNERIVIDFLITIFFAYKEFPG
jgi:hypothetical protein